MSGFCVRLVEDDADLRQALNDTLAIGGFTVIAVDDPCKALDVLARQPISLVLSDIQMEPWSGLELLARIRRQYRDIPVVLMTAFGTVPQAVEAIRQGAMDYRVKPVEAQDLLGLVSRFRDRPSSSRELVAVDRRSLELKTIAGKVARADISVLLTGPSGSGKEVFARYIHDVSERAPYPFVAVNCAAIPDQMLEAELFGHEKGAFTGAVRTRLGKFEAAEGGTLLLDEISEMDLGLQAKLLRVLQERELERLGGNRLIRLDVRVIATTNRDLAAAVAAGRFREDLYYRLNVFPLQLPSLRERPGDIEPLAKRALAMHFRGVGAGPALTRPALDRLQQHDWPGNVRELENVIQRALVLAPASAELSADDLFFEGPPASAAAAAPPDAGTLQAALEDRESNAIVAVLREEGGHRGRAAERLGISPRTLRYKLTRIRNSGITIPGDAGTKFAAAGQ
ncbi:sigma-54-dependent Fis family transcriptional regulator [Kineobactrum sediminis]|uniref:Sigma-54-dependent Fis family transcriptional regulator n=1 Tax=Kineobactrum sediminis TaxID=1905677 RepID=A0A2N5Y6G3_9GAMM|nr:sigma-54 dependent transcriptional regulator [Kineobactrum sediminis]PLW83976.1 sigma-54-dependent Fis family transcriptional regulator [Kineobactrum sediminis]